MLAVAEISFIFILYDIKIMAKYFVPSKWCLTTTTTTTATIIAGTLSKTTTVGNYQPAYSGNLYLSNEAVVAVT